MRSPVESARLVLDKIRLALRDRASSDPAAEVLVHEACNIAQRVVLFAGMSQKSEYSPGAVRVYERRIVEETVALNERVKEYCDANRVYYVTRPTSSTTRMSSEEIRRALDSMPPGATEPPASVRGAILEAQFPDRAAVEDEASESENVK